MRAWLLLWACLLVACGGHQARTRDIRGALDAADPTRALALLNEELGVDKAEELPASTSGDNAILLLDRAMVLQQLDRYELSARDLRVADKQIDVLDLSRGAADELGKYLFSDDTGPYRAPAYEKLMINTMNLVNYLVRGDLNGARIEARRLAVMQRFVREHEDPALALSAPGSYLAGFTFEQSRRPQEALRYYDEALAFSEYPSLIEPVLRLSGQSSYRSPRIRKLLKQHAPAPSEPASPSSEPAAPTGETEPAPSSPEPTEPETTTSEAEPVRDERGEILVIVSFGRVPAKYAKRVPIGLALTYASGAMSPQDRQRASYLAAQGLVTWVNYPELGQPRGTYGVPSFTLGAELDRLDGILAVDRESIAAWEKARGVVVASAITRMLTRVVAGEAVRRSTGGTLGALLSLGAQATLTATDTPDTRCWATLPARIAFGRVRVAPGAHTIELQARGVTKRQTVRVTPGGFAVVALTVLH
ncbi:MAG: hypothetical protein KF718_15330 [Polyangiaceae bacterium]|nr:hypothetical protein [Polyangiaceae bacterium]